MSTLKEFNIVFTSLKLGVHEYEYEVKESFFKHFDADYVVGSEAQVLVTLEKHTTFMELIIKSSKSITTACDRCLEDVDIPVDGTLELIVKFGTESYEESSDELIILPPHEYQLNVAQHIFECIFLTIPIRRAHEEGACDLEDYSDNTDESDEDIDPRWAALKSLNINK